MTNYVCRKAGFCQPFVALSIKRMPEVLSRHRQSRITPRIEAHLYPELNREAQTA